VKSIEAQELIDKIQNKIESKGIDPAQLVKDLKKLRTYALEEKNPLVTKVLRMTYEHLSTEGTFRIPIPDDEPIEELDGDEVETYTIDNPEKEDPAQSLLYLLSIIRHAENKGNISELTEYRDALIDYMENQ
jgi:hypothetical protein